jgi:outer membrane lipoprotein-sorting protein
MVRFSCIAALTALATVPAAAQAPANADIAAVQAHLRSLQTMTATFQQTDRSGKRLMGELKLKRPGKVRFQYKSGAPILIVGDGKFLIFHDSSVNQTSSWPIKKSPLAALLDPNFDASKSGTLLPSPPGQLIVELRDQSQVRMGSLKLYFSRQPAGPAGLAIIGWVTLDAQGNQTTIALSNQKFNVPIADSWFRFERPNFGPRR